MQHAEQSMSAPEALRQAQSVAIAVAPNGGRRGKQDHPALPIGPDELAETAEKCLIAGAAMIHVHVRDREGRHSLDPEAYRAATEAIRERVGRRLVVQMTSESLGAFTPEQQMETVRAVRPEAVSLALRELAPDAAHEAVFASFLDWLRRERVMAQIILYSAEEASRLGEMEKRGLIPFDEVPVLFVLGRYSPGQISEPADLLPFIDPRPPASRHWMVCAFGHHETACVTAAALLGGHARVGFENNLHMPDGTLAAGNEDLVSAARKALEACGLTLAGADDLRGQWAASAGS